MARTLAKYILITRTHMQLMRLRVAGSLVFAVCTSSLIRPSVKSCDVSSNVFAPWLHSGITTQGHGTSCISSGRMEGWGTEDKTGYKDMIM